MLRRFLIITGVLCLLVAAYIGFVYVLFQISKRNIVIVSNEQAIAVQHIAIRTSDNRKLWQGSLHATSFEKFTFESNGNEADFIVEVLNKGSLKTVNLGYIDSSLGGTHSIRIKKNGTLTYDFQTASN